MLHLHDETIHFQKNGYLVLKDFLTSQDCAELKQRAHLYQNGLSTDLPPIYAFSTTDYSHMQYEYFAQARSALFCFFAEDKLSKISASLHDLDPVFCAFSRQHKIKSLVAQLGVHKPLLVQSMYLFKPPSVNEIVTTHQDSSFLDTTPSSMMTLWFALEDATLQNGCLWVYPHEHPTPLRQRLTRNGKNLEMNILDPKPWSEEGKMALEVKAGSLVIIDGHLPHGSGPNLSEHTRQAFTLHIVDGQHPYDSVNWLQPSGEDYFKGF